MVVIDECLLFVLMCHVYHSHYMTNSMVHFVGSAPSFTVVHTSYRDAAYFLKQKDAPMTVALPASTTGATPVPAGSIPSPLPSPMPPSSTAKHDVVVLALSQTGRQLHVLSAAMTTATAASSAAGKVVVSQTYELGAEMSALWTAPAGTASLPVFSLF